MYILLISTYLHLHPTSLLNPYPIFIASIEQILLSLASFSCSSTRHYYNDILVYLESFQRYCTCTCTCTCMHAFSWMTRVASLLSTFLCCNLSYGIYIHRHWSGISSLANLYSNTLPQVPCW